MSDPIAKFIEIKYYYNERNVVSKLHQQNTSDQQVRIQDFKLGGGGTHLKNCTERKEVRKYFGYFVWKITILRH